MFAPGWRKPIPRFLVETEHGDFQSLKGQFTRWKRVNRMWRDEAGEVGAGCAGLCRPLQGSAFCLTSAGKPLEYFDPGQRATAAAGSSSMLKR